MLQGWAFFPCHVLDNTFAANKYIGNAEKERGETCFPTWGAPP